MPSFYRGDAEYMDMFVRLKLSIEEYELLSTDLNNFISRSVLVKMEGAVGGGRSGSGSGTLGELRQVCRPF